MAPPPVVLVLILLAMFCPVRSHDSSGFLSDGECDHLVKLAKSMVADNDDSGKSVMSQVRTSSGTFLAMRTDDIVAAIDPSEASTDDGAAPCSDASSQCPRWAAAGRCSKNPTMRRLCPKSCNLCVAAIEPPKVSTDDYAASCFDASPQCLKWAAARLCSRNPTVRRLCRRSCNLCVA